MLLEDAGAHGRAIVSALRAVYGVELGDDAVQLIEPWGKTDLRIARDVLHRAGLEDAEIDRGLGAWLDAAGSAFPAEADSLAPRWRIRTGLLAALEQLRSRGMRLTVLTGNLRAIAAVKIARMGLGDHLDLAIGAYADDDEDRTRLVAVARKRAGTPGRAWPRRRTVVVGDTPRDLACARADGVPAVLFCSPRYPAEALGGADAVISEVGELVATLESWQAHGSPA